MDHPDNWPEAHYIVELYRRCYGWTSPDLVTWGDPSRIELREHDAGSWLSGPCLGEPEGER